MSKRFFYQVFAEAWNESFTYEHIVNAFEKTSIWPLNPDKILSTIRKPNQEPTTPTTLIASNIIKTPRTTRAIRRTHAMFQKTHATPVLDKILSANIQLAAQVAIQSHIIAGLQASLKLEKQKRTRGKALNLVGEDSAGPQFYSPGRINRALEYQADLAAQAKANKARIADKKVQAAVNKAQKQAAKVKRALQAEARRQHVAEEKAQKAAEVAARRAAKQAQLAATKAEMVAKKQAKEASKGSSTPKVVVRTTKKSQVVAIGGGSHGIPNGAIVRQSRTRTVVTPQRFRM